MSPQALFLNGAVGVGKTATLEALGDLLAGRPIPRALIDLDWLREVWPAPSDDPFNLKLELANLTAVAANSLSCGARVLAMAGVLETTGSPRFLRAPSVPADRDPAEGAARVGTGRAENATRGT